MGYDIHWDTVFTLTLGGMRRGGVCPRTLCARFALQYGWTISNLLPTGLVCVCVCACVTNQLMSFVLLVIVSLREHLCCYKTVPESPRRGIRCNLVGVAPTKFMLILAIKGVYRLAT